MEADPKASLSQALTVQANSLPIPQKAHVPKFAPPSPEFADVCPYVVSNRSPFLNMPSVSVKRHIAPDLTLQLKEGPALQQIKEVAL
ncbi:hypothetical protein R6Q59_009541 [Mikania micrantha]